MLTPNSLGQLLGPKLTPKLTAKHRLLFRDSFLLLRLYPKP